MHAGIRRGRGGPRFLLVHSFRKRVHSILSFPADMNSYSTTTTTTLHDATIPYCEAIISAAPSFAAKITRLILAVDCQGPVGNVKWMEIIHSLQSLVQIELSDLFKINDSVNWPGEIVKLPSVEVLPPVNLQILRIISSELRGLPFIQVIFRWLHRSQTRISTVEFRSLAIKSTKDPNKAPLKPFFRYLKFLGPSLEILMLEFSDKKNQGSEFISSYIL